MTKIYVLLKTDITEGSDYRPSCVGAYGSERAARAEALRALEDYKSGLEANGRKADVDKGALRCCDESGTYGIKLGISEVELTGVQVGAVEDL